MKKHKTITISLPVDLIDYLDDRISQINKDTFEETNRSKYIRLLIRRDMVDPEKTSDVKRAPTTISTDTAPDNDVDYYTSLLQLGGYKR